jgi:hypothetical protein
VKSFFVTASSVLALLATTAVAHADDAALRKQLQDLAAKLETLQTEVALHAEVERTCPILNLLREPQRVTATVDHRSPQVPTTWPDGCANRFKRSSTMPVSVNAIDHFVIRVTDLDAEALYRRLGFALTPRGFHVGRGSANHTAPFSSGNYFELIHLPDGQALPPPSDRTAAGEIPAPQSGFLAEVQDRSYGDQPSGVDKAARGQQEFDLKR